MSLIQEDFLSEKEHFSYFIAGSEQNSTTLSYILRQQLSEGQRLEVNVPLIETYWTTDGNSQIDRTQFQSKCIVFLVQNFVSVY